MTKRAVIDFEFLGDPVMCAAGAAPLTRGCGGDGVTGGARPAARACSLRVHIFHATKYEGTITERCGVRARGAAAVVVGRAGGAVLLSERGAALLLHAATRCDLSGSR